MELGSLMYSVTKRLLMAYSNMREHDAISMLKNKTYEELEKELKVSDWLTTIVKLYNKHIIKSDVEKLLFPTDILDNNGYNKAFWPNDTLYSNFEFYDNGYGEFYKCMFDAIKEFHDSKVYNCKVKIDDSKWGYRPIKTKKFDELSMEEVSRDMYLFHLVCEYFSMKYLGFGKIIDNNYYFKNFIMEDDACNAYLKYKNIEGDGEKHKTNVEEKKVDDILTTLDNLDNLNSENNEDDLSSLSDELENSDESSTDNEEQSIEELFAEFIDSIKKLSKTEVDQIGDVLNKMDAVETDDLNVAGLKIDADGVISNNNYNPKIKKLTIKESYNGIKVKVLNDIFRADFTSNNPELEEVIIEGDISFKSSFANCKKLRNIQVNGKIINLNSYNFFSCYELITMDQNCEYIRINNNDYYLLNTGPYKAIIIYPVEGCEIIVAEAFSNSNIEMISFPSTLKRIGRRAFAECQKLDFVSLNEGLEYIDELAFETCKSLTSIDIPNSVKYIGHQAFLGCNNLSNVTISKKCKYEDNTFPKSVKIVLK